jgi:hypothetical protein
MLRTIHSSTCLELIEFVVRKVNRDDEQGLNFDNIFSYLELIENLLNFELNSSEYGNSVRPKLANKLVKYLLPAAVLATRVPSNNVRKSNETMETF